MVKKYEHISKFHPTSISQYTVRYKMLCMYLARQIQNDRHVARQFWDVRGWANIFTKIVRNNEKYLVTDFPTLWSFNSIRKKQENSKVFKYYLLFCASNIIVLFPDEQILQKMYHAFNIEYEEENVLNYLHKNIFFEFSIIETRKSFVWNWKTGSTPYGRVRLPRNQQERI